MAQGPINEAPYRLLEDVTLEDNVVVLLFTNLYGCEVGANTRIGPLVEIQKRVRIGANCKIQSHAFICTGVEIEDEVFVGVSSSPTSSRARPPRAGCRTRATGSSCRPRWSVERGSARGQWSRVESTKANGATQTRGWLRRGQRFGSRVGEYGDELSSIRAGASEREHLNDAFGKEPQPANDR